MESRTKKTIGLVSLLVLLIGATAVVWYLILWPRYFAPVTQVSVQPQGQQQQPSKIKPDSAVVETTSNGLISVVSAEDLADYFASSNLSYGVGVLRSASGVAETDAASTETIGFGSSDQTERYSETNVQVSGIDEPDIVKTDGEQLYIAPDILYRYAFSSDVSENPKGGDGQQLSKTTIVDALPVEDISVLGNIDEAATDLLLHDDTLIVFSDSAVTGYDVKTSSAPKDLWSLALNQDQYSSVVMARLYNDNLYLVTVTYPDSALPCPYAPLSTAAFDIEISCSDILRPQATTDSRGIYTVLVINPGTGEVQAQAALAVESYQSVMTMFDGGIYLTYVEQPDQFLVYRDFFANEGATLIDDGFTARLEEIDSYDIHSDSKLTELYYEIQKLDSSADIDQNTGLSAFDLAWTKYQESHARDLEKTTIVRMALDDLSIEATGQVPGDLLNQFSIDESDGFLRLATTIHGPSNDTSVNDLYVLDENLAIVGSVADLGAGERIYSARFVGAAGYIVTYRETDPFFVFDLSNPELPKVVGELKIPGYSSYLHPVDDVSVLGVGKNEKGKIKLSWFDVTDPTTPVESSKAVIEEDWSGVLSTHHAFLLDSVHSVFFIPAGDNGYVYSYAGGLLKQVQEVIDIKARRAVYINDYLYIIGSNSVVVLDESTWKIVATLNLTK
ncbi:MAG: hypothetical protein COW24_03175 [Candidatus Kerfeldbacteria bacterium CG15_BIG_FIL_POST_REV_8_21_14_020_45_12]|uniref:Beta propeller domain-containing protein n=1 Tax=Candidatus Kerfeldbacteria bacterium CG15_BIG_FIL_POST_REV_8_21_14_020_45_12 TaxID=2014247 RepID=A0A2M7H3Z0_9BACT|nr:MAG: hypothetical protein COW24_03175 [Candidatus Kerfeldbacteria bacterium CG15_BIG_FIL_POST_REV_8_21_14_020_45_12]PJA92766.1 MAG: hypothetical protein CO132_06275 [Candidatus Kerfeldbacteria bacterium CG_4_9_14_3_um_filter_45_8]